MTKQVSTTWALIFSEKAKNNLDQLDKIEKQRIVDFLNNKVLTSQNPRSYEKPLKGKLRTYWAFRVGDYRLLTHIDDGKLIILVVHIGHRREVYKHTEY